MSTPVDYSVLFGTAAPKPVDPKPTARKVADKDKKDLEAELREWLSVDNDALFTPLGG